MEQFLAFLFADGDDLVALEHDCVRPKWCSDAAPDDGEERTPVRDREVTRAPSPQRRLDAVKKLNEAGIPCGVLMAPIIPFVSDSDEQLEETVAAIAASGATHLYPIVLHLRTGAREWFTAWLEEHRPEAVGRYRDLYAKGAYAPKAFQEDIATRVHALTRKYRVGAGTPRSARRMQGPVKKPVRPEPEQLSFG